MFEHETKKLFIRLDEIEIKIDDIANRMAIKPITEKIDEELKKQTQEALEKKGQTCTYEPPDEEEDKNPAL